MLSRKQEVRIIGLLVDKSSNVPVGYRFLVSGHKYPYNVGFERTNDILNNQQFHHFYSNNGLLHPSDGELNQLPKIDIKTKKVIENAKIIILGQLADYNSDHTIALQGYRITDHTGKIKDVTVKEALAYRKRGYYNAKIELLRGEEVLIATRGYMEVITPNVEGGFIVV